MTTIGKIVRTFAFVQLHKKETHERNKDKTRVIHCIITYYYFMTCEISNRSKLLSKTPQKEPLQLYIFYYYYHAIFYFPFSRTRVEFVKNFSQILLDGLTIRVPRCIKISHSMKRKASQNNRKMFENVETNYHQARRSEEFIIFNACQRIIQTRQAELASSNNQL